MANHDTHDHAGVTGVPSLTAPNPTTIELGHASDTTLARVSAGVVSIEGTNIVKAGAATSSGITMATARLLGRTTAATGAIEEITVGAGLSLSAGSLTATAGGFPGLVPVATHIGFDQAGAGTNGVANQAWAMPISIPGAMQLRSMVARFNSSAAGAVQWGLFDYSSSASAATKLAGGSAAPGGTDWRAIAATGAPVAIPAGNYMLVFHHPAATVSVVYSHNSGAASTFNKSQTGYTWDDTPDFTTGWSGSSINPVCYLLGDIIAGTSW